jgi:tyrosinase
MATKNRPVDELPTRLRLRVSVEKLSVQQGQRLDDAIAAIAQLSDDRGFQYYARLHGGPPRVYCQHGTRDALGRFQGAPLFLPWHRAYLHFMELSMQDRVPDVTHAWWDWTSPRSHADGIPELYDQGALASQPIAEGFPRRPGVPDVTSRDPDDAANLPTTVEVEQIVALESFGDFSTQLENQLHNRIHGWVGGAMGAVPIAAFDPVFYAHHAMVDRIWRLWQLRHGRPGPPESAMPTVLPPFPVRVADVIDVTRLGYDYAGSATGAPGTT